MRIETLHSHLESYPDYEPPSESQLLESFELPVLIASNTEKIEPRTRNEEVQKLALGMSESPFAYHLQINGVDRESKVPRFGNNLHSRLLQVQTCEYN